MQSRPVSQVGSINGEMAVQQGAHPRSPRAEDLLQWNEAQRDRCTAKQLRPPRQEDRCAA
jgi:hypothetical protein